MKDVIFKFLSSSANTMTGWQILLNFAAATAIGILIFICYRVTHSRAVYSAKFNVSLLMMAVITTLIMSVIGNNIALSLGMVGALSVIRFRTAIKDVRDLTYIFWCIAIGICCGVSEFALAGVGSAVIFCIMLLFGAVHSDETYMVIVRSSCEKEAEVVEVIKDFFGGKATLKVDNSTKDYAEVIYEVKQNVFRKKSKKGNLSDMLYEIESVSMVNIVCQSEEISR